MDEPTPNGKGNGEIETITCLLHPNLISCADIMETVFPGYVPVSMPVYYIYHRYGPLAQSREQRICNSKVAGWSPAWSTTYDTGRLLQ